MAFKVNNSEYSISGTLGTGQSLNNSEYKIDFIIGDLITVLSNVNYEMQLGLLYQWNATNIGDTTSPTYSGNKTNATSTTPKINQDIQINLTMNDETGLSHFIFSWNNSGSFANDSAVAISGLSYIMSLNKTATDYNTSDFIHPTIGWKVYFNDTSNNQNETDVFTFRLINTAPTINASTYFGNTPQNGAINNTNIIITGGCTDIDNDILYYYFYLDSSSPPYVLKQSNTSNSYITNLSIDGTYYYRYVCGDLKLTSGFSAIRSYIFNITTISNIINYSITTTSATINWTTDELTNSTLFYGTTTSVLNEISNSSFFLSHSISLTNLNPNTLYYYNVSSCESGGYCTTSSQYSFTSLSIPTEVITPTGGAVSGGAVTLDQLKQQCLDKNMSYEIINDTIYCILKEEVLIEKPILKQVGIGLLSLFFILLIYGSIVKRRTIRKEKLKRQFKKQP